MSFTERAGLFPVLLLTGCASPVVVTGPPSGSVVDNYLTRSAADISAMQYRLHQSGPSAIRPGPSVSPKASAPPLSRPLTPASPNVSTVRSAGVSDTAGSGPSDGFIRQSGAAPTLRAALRSIVPPGQTVVFDKTVAADAPQLWRWAGNDRWQYVVNKMLVTHGLKATVNTQANTVMIEPVQRAQAAAATVSTVSKAVPPGTSGKTTSAGMAKATMLPTTGRNPFHGDTVAGSNASPGQNGSPDQGLRTGAVPDRVPVAVPLRHWRIEAGNTVKDWLYSQASAEPCTVPGIKNWTIAWLTPTNYRVDAPLNFEGSFREMLNGLFTLYGTAKVPLYAGTRAVQCVVSVDDKEVQ